MIARTAFDIERTRISSGSIGVKRILVRRLIVFVAGKVAPGTYANDFPARPDAFAARRTIGIKRACYGLCARKHQCQSNKPIFHAELLHESPTYANAWAARN
jgi:hypothetical protein